MTARVSKDRHTSPSLLRRLKFWLLNLLFGRQQGLPLLRPEQLRRVLLLRHDRLGDAIITTPLIDALRHLNPAVQIDVIAAPANREFFQNDPRIGVVEVLQGSPLQRLGLILRCRRRRYDAGLQLVLGRTTLPAILLGLCLPTGRTLGMRVPLHERLFNHSIPIPSELHFSERTLAVLTRNIAAGMELPHFPYSIPLRPHDVAIADAMLAEKGLLGKQWILLNISTGKADRNFSDQQNVALAKGLAGLGLPVGIIASPKEHGRASRIATEAGAGVTPLPFGTLGAVMSGIGNAALVATPDTAIVHITSAMGRPIVAMIPADVVGGWEPLGVPSRVIIAGGAATMEPTNTEPTNFVKLAIAAAGELLGIAARQQ
ncbi:MAG: lipopolysaccharide heptosyltransferase family protein [Chlorobi bacterium CHB2]|nr:lipopolysaccharide heptosyltransferase family protein [Chlorobi bacterium CHB2]